MVVKGTDFSMQMRFDCLTPRMVWDWDLTRDYIVNKDYIGMHEGPLKTFKIGLVPPFFNLHRPKPTAEPPHLYNSPTAVPKVNPFKKVFIAMKATVRRFINGRKAGREPGESAAPGEDTI